ncbi:MAG TPA: ABC transporter ATP-binding protein [Geminicoccaceae bacterium]|nr:ABC transporter ATP-binding protein [Geminicoccaceae bacterium]
MSLLEVRDVYGGYGAADILNGVDLTLDEGQIVVIIGPNGAGKSTLMKAVFGLVRVRSGTIRFAGEDITNVRPDQLVPKGMSYVPQERNVFPSLTVQENLEMGAYIRDDDYSADLEQVFQIFPVLEERRRQPAGQMSGGERQMVALGRALMVRPRLLLLDEPTAGLSPKFIDQIFERVLAINALGISVLMVEQNAKKALGFAHRGYVLVGGANRYEDTGPALLANPEMAEMFLGG